MAKKLELTDPKTLLLIFGVLVLLNVGGIGDKFWGMFDSGVTPAGGDTDIPCLHDGATMTIGPMQKMYAPGTDVSNEYARVFVNGVDHGLKADSANVEVSPGDKIDIYYGENSSSYYAARQSFDAPCKSDFPSGDSTLDNDAYKLYAPFHEGTLNITNRLVCFSDDDDTVMTDSIAQTASGPEDITDSEQPVIECKLMGVPKRAFSPYAPGGLCFYYNSTTYDSITPQDKDENAFSAIAKPTFLTPDETSWDEICFEVPSLISSEELEFDIVFDVADSGATNEESNNVTVVLIDQDWYRDSVSGEMEMGFANNENSNIGTTYDDDGEAVVNLTFWYS